MSAIGVSLSAGDDGGQRSGPIPAEGGLAPVEEVTAQEVKKLLRICIPVLVAGMVAVFLKNMETFY